MSKRNPGLIKRYGNDGKYTWHIDKQIKGYGRLCEGTQTDDENQAAEILSKRVNEIRNARVHGVRPSRTFRSAATKYLEDFAHKPGIGRQGTALQDLDPFIGDKWIHTIHNETLKLYITTRRNPPEPEEGEKQRRPLKIGTINRNLGVVRRVLNLCARLWRDEDTNLSWLAEAPLIQMLDDPDARVAYPIDWAEQDLLFAELTPLLKDMSEFGVNSGVRDQSICGLKWAWEQRVPELDSNGFKRTVFVLPRRKNQKSKQPAVVILNDVAQAIVDKYRGQHPVYVFTWVDSEGNRDRIGRIRNTGWVAARRRASKKYLEVIGEPPPKGFQNLRVHDLKHTFGKRLRAAGVPNEDRKDLLGHKQKDVTTDYSAAELARLLEAANRVVRSKTESRKTPALTVLRLVA